MALLGVILCLPLNGTWSMFDVAIRLAVVGLGFGFYIPPSNVAIMAATPRDHLGVGGGVLNTGRFLGFALGPDHRHHHLEARACRAPLASLQ